jgi:hypothetical protein
MTKPTDPPTWEEHERYWLEYLQRKVRGIEFFFPNDERNPAPGSYAAVSPTSKVAQSSISVLHAALLYLSQFHSDEGARALAIRLASEKRPR